jgi:hypothetical protein
MRGASGAESVILSVRWHRANVYMRLDKMTAEQRTRFEAHCADRNARSIFPLPITCTTCEKLIADPGAVCGPQELPPSAVVIPFFGYFCSQGCADTFERDYGIQFKRAATGEVSYD